MAEITLEQSFTEIDDLQSRARSARKSGESDDALDVLRALLEHPCADHQIVEHEVLDEIHTVLRGLGRYDEAIEAKRAAIAAGYRSRPDPEADIAECLVEAGRRSDADALYSALRERDPDDPWLYNSAGFAYRGVDDREALRWLLDGIDVAIATGDHDQVIGQLLGLAREQWDGLGEQPDGELIGRVEEFERNWQRPSHASHRWLDAPPIPQPQPCSHCGFDPDRPPDAPWVPPPAQSAASKMALSLAWFPAEQWAVAVTRWPDLLDEMPAEHDAYSRRIEARLKWLAKKMPGHKLSVSPLDVDELVLTRSDDAGTGEGRSLMAAELARTGRGVNWPPSRNEPCWCGSSRKYKKCCGPTPIAEDSA
jgi:hypothetical protein